jgi:hypothetical protein
MIEAKSLKNDWMKRNAIILKLGKADVEFLGSVYPLKF